jgi:hypothetical protein
MREDIFIPEHRTNVLPLRWLANNVFHRASMVFFHIGLKANDKLEYDYVHGTLIDEIKEKIGFAIYRVLNVPYDKWGTVYKFEIPIDFQLDGAMWDDYDESGTPYWDYLWHEDPITGDAWRIVKGN